MTNYALLTINSHSARKSVAPGRVTVAALVSGGRHVGLAWQEARPVVQAMFQMRFLSAAALSASYVEAVDVGTLVTGAAAWLCATWHVYLLNGLSDQVEDQRNGSRRPLASGRLPVAAARTVAHCLAVGALLLGATVSVWLALLVAAMLTLGWAYSAGRRPQKSNMAGFVAVVTGGGLVTYLAGCAAVGARPDARLAVLMVAMSLWMALAGTTKDLSDVVGDRAAGRRTLPILLGDRNARRLMAVMALSVGALLLTGALTVAPDLLPAASVLLTGAIAVAACTVLTHGAAGRGRQRGPYRLFMSCQYAVHLAVLHVALSDHLSAMIPLLGRL